MLPAVVLLAVVGVWAVLVGTAQLRCTDAAGVGARALARGEPADEVRRVVAEVAPRGARVELDRTGELVVVEVRMVVPLPGPWGGTGRVSRSATGRSRSTRARAPRRAPWTRRDGAVPSMRRPRLGRVAGRLRSRRWSCSATVLAVGWGGWCRPAPGRQHRRPRGARRRPGGCGAGAAEPCAAAVEVAAAAGPVESCEELADGSVREWSSAVRAVPRRAGLLVAARRTGPGSSPGRCAVASVVRGPGVARRWRRVLVPVGQVGGVVDDPVAVTCWGRSSIPVASVGGAVGRRLVASAAAPPAAPAVVSAAVVPREPVAAPR